MVYRLGMNGKVSSKAIHAALKDNEYELVIENYAEGIFRMEAIKEEAVVDFDYTPAIERVETELETLTSIPSDDLITEEPIFEPANNEVYDEF